MTWGKVRWSEAAQVLDVLATPAEERAPGASGPPDAYFAGLRKAERRSEAADFLSQALPRLEAVAWAARVVRDQVPPAASSDPRARALRATLFWVQDPTDQRRRAAFDAAQACEPKGPEALAAYAAFFSGGSISVPDQPAVLPPKETSGKFVAAAVKVATLPADKTGAALDKALDAGEVIAREGLKAD